MIAKKHITSLVFILGLTAAAILPQLLIAENSSKPPITARIIDGSVGSTNLFPEVAEIFVNGSICSGTLIAPDYVLTAGHCAYDDFGRVIRDMQDVTLIIGNETRGAKSIHVHPKYNNDAEACTEGIPDASLIRLDSPIFNIPSARLASSPPTIGEQLQIVGYGMLGNGKKGQQSGLFPGQGELSYGRIPVDKVGSTFISWRFRANQNSSNTAGGDSGGPAFKTINGERFLSSITCGGTGNAEWGTDSYNTRVDILSHWLNEFIAAKSATTFRIRESILQLGGNNSTADSFTIFGQVKTLKSLIKRNSQLTMSIGGYQESFTLRLKKGRAQKNGASLTVSRITIRNGQRVTLNFKIVLSTKSLFQEIRTLGFPELSSASAGNEQVLPTIFDFAGNRTTINQPLRLDSTDLRWHLVK
jgi:hypothetical protein